MTKRLVVAILVVAVAALAALMAGCGGDLPSDAVAKVGDSVILKSDFDQRVQDFATQYSVTPKDQDPEGWADFEGQVLEYLITYEVVAQKAVGMDISVSDDEVQQQIDSIISSYYSGDEAAFTADLESNNLSVDAIKLNYKESMLMQKVYEKVTEDITTAPDDKIAAYYEENKDQYFQEETRTTRHILIIPGTSSTAESTTTTTASSDDTDSTSSSTTTTSELTQADWDAALATAEEVRAKLVAGGDWTELAAEYSDDPSTADSGGELGDVYRGQMVPEFEDAVFSLKVDEISQPVKTSYGYHIIEVTAINEAKQFTLDDSTVKDDVTSAVVNKLKTEAWQKWVEDARNEIGVVYQTGMEPSTTTTTASASTDTTDGSGLTTTTAATDTNGSTATTAGGETIGGDTTTTAGP